MAKAKAGQHAPGYLEIGVPAAHSRAALTPPEGVVAFGQMALGRTPAPHVAWACQIFSFLDKATRTAPSQRSASHLTPYARDFAQWLTQFCEFFGPLTTQVRPFSLLLDGEIVFQDQQLQGIAARLYQDGIVALTWLPEVTQDEILLLMQILLAAPVDDDESDLMVLLWQAGFSHITVDVYDRSPAPAPEVQLEREQIMETLQIQMQLDSLCSVNFHGLRAVPIAASGLAETPIPQAAAPLTLEHNHAIQSQLANEEASLALRSSEFFLLTLTQLKESRDLKQLEKWLLPVLESLFASRAFEALSFLIDDLLDLGQGLRPTLHEAYNAMQVRLLTHLSQPEYLASLVQLLEMRGGISEERMRGVRHFFQTLVVVLKGPFVESLGALTSEPEQLLAAVMGDHPQ